MEKGFSFSEVERGIVLAADVFFLENLRKLVEQAIGISQVVGIKAGFLLTLKYGLPSIVKAVNKISSLPIIYDHQKAATDIPAMGRPFAETYRNAGVKGVIFFPQAGPKTLRVFVSAAFDHEIEPFLELAMTHPQYLSNEGGYIVSAAPEKICAVGMELGVRNFVLPGTKPDVVRKFAQGPLKAIQPATIMLPGKARKADRLHVC